MDSSSCSPTLATQGTRSSRKPSVTTTEGAVFSSKPRKPPTSAGSKHSTKIVHGISKLTSPTSKHNERRSEFDKLQPQKYCEDDQLPDVEDKVVTTIEASIDCMVSEAKEQDHIEVKRNDHFAEEIEGLAEEKIMEHNKQVIRDYGALEKGKAMEKGNQISTSLHDNINQNDYVENPEKTETDTREGQNSTDCAGKENFKSGRVDMISNTEADCVGQIPKSNVETLDHKMIEGSSQLVQLLPAGEVASKENDSKNSAALSQDGSKQGDLLQPNEDSLFFTGHLDSEQEGFLFAKGEPAVKETVQSSESLPAGNISTKTQINEMDLMRFQAALTEASDFQAAKSANSCLDTASVSAAQDLMESAVLALAKDMFAGKLSNLEREIGKKTFFRMPTWKLSMQAFLTPSLVISALGVVLWHFILVVLQDNREHLHPT